MAAEGEKTVTNMLFNGAVEGYEGMFGGGYLV